MKLPRPITLSQVLSKIEEPWSPVGLGQVNETAIKVARFEGQFQWHEHKAEDELFLVLSGTLQMRLRSPSGNGSDATEEQEFILETGEMILIPRGTPHCPASVGAACEVLLIEPATTINTGDGPANARTREVTPWNQRD